MNSCFCGLREIALTAIELQGKNQTTVNRGVEYSNRTVTAVHEKY